MLGCVEWFYDQPNYLFLHILQRINYSLLMLQCMGTSENLYVKVRVFYEAWTKVLLKLKSFESSNTLQDSRHNYSSWEGNIGCTCNAGVRFI